MHLAQIKAQISNFYDKITCKFSLENPAKHKWDLSPSKDHICVNITTITSSTFPINLCIDRRVCVEWERCCIAGKMTHLLRFPPYINPQLEFSLSILFLPTVGLSCPGMSNLYFKFFSKDLLVVSFLLLTQTTKKYKL